MEGFRWENRESEYARAKEAASEEKRDSDYVPRGVDLISASQRALDESAVLAGNRWLSRKAGSLFIAPSGHGKSLLSIQLTINWGCGRPAFGINPAQPLRILIVQSEDDDNDVTEFAQCVSRMNLSASEMALIQQNTHIEWINDVTATRFFARTRTIIEKKGPFDLLIINPLGAYLEKDPRDPLSIVNFRVALCSLLEEFLLGAVIIHHTPKTRFMDTENFNWWDWMYAAAGDSGLVNWARSVLVIWPTELPGTYKFIAAKRGDRIGWTEKEYHFSWSSQNGIPLWVPSTQDQIKSASGADKTAALLAVRARQVDEIFALIPQIEPIDQHQLFEAASCNEKRVRQILAYLVAEGRIWAHKIPTGRRGQQLTGYAKTPA